MFISLFRLVRRKRRRLDAAARRRRRVGRVAAHPSVPASRPTTSTTTTKTIITILVYRVPSRRKHLHRAPVADRWLRHQRVRGRCREQALVAYLDRSAAARPHRRVSRRRKRPSFDIQRRSVALKPASSGRGVNFRSTPAQRDAAHHSCRHHL